ncbi:MAG TPA: hypothetical protein VKA60_01660 [Blastocatellia bacterium]|nr:hypothetical protein [Blastocatellia bacterium]
MSHQARNRLQLKIADIAVALDIADASKRAAVVERYREFLTSDGEPQATVRVEVHEGARFVPLHSGPWVIELSEAHGRLLYRSHYDAGWIESDSGNSFVEIAPEVDIENFLRVLYAQLCLRNGGLLLHAAGVIHDGAGFVFFGPSGSGKTTVARLSLGHTVLSDDLVIVRLTGDVARVYGLPFRGDFPEAPRINQSAELRGLFQLVKAPDHRLAAVAAPEAFARLLACAPFVMIDAARARQAMHICRQIMARAAVRALHFRRDPGFWRVLGDD